MEGQNKSLIYKTYGGSKQVINLQNIWRVKMEPEPKICT